ncbi:MAG: YfiR family protein [Bacteroidales bacterium]|nr:YfiR family protein [Bacteroidales bacterium]
MAKSIPNSSIKLWILIVLSVGIFWSNRLPAQNRESLLKAGYIEKFTHFVEWPELQQKNDSVFKIVVMGENGLGQAVKKLFKGIKVKNRKVEIQFIHSADEINHAMMLIITGELSRNQLQDVLTYTRGRQILTISESKGYAKKGIIINMFKENNYIRYEINTSTLAQSGLKINSLLLNYAVIVKTDD